MHARRDGSQTRGCSPLQASTWHEEGKLEHFGAFLPWVVSKLVLSQNAIAQPWMCFQTCRCTSSIPWDKAGARPPLAGAKGTHCGLPACLPACCRQTLSLNPGTKGKGREQPARALFRLIEPPRSQH